MELTILGNSSATPTITRNQTSQVLSYQGRNYLLDCGEGAQAQMLRLGVNQNRIRQVFISHLHPDHFTGLIGFITTQNLRHREQPLEIFAPKGMEAIIRTQLYHSNAHLHFDLFFHELSEIPDNTLLFEDDHLQVHVYHLDHRIPCFGFIFEEKWHKQKLDKASIKQAPPPVEAFSYLEKGLDFEDEKGLRYTANFYTLPHPPTRSFAYFTDTRIQWDLASYLKGVGTLYHEATFGEKFEKRAYETYHSTASQAAQLAEKAKAKQLLLGHFSARYGDLGILLNEARNFFPETYLAIQGERFAIQANYAEEKAVKD